MNGATANEGVQVLKVGEGEKRYELDEEALQQLLLKPAVRDLPVVVVSIAGAFRGGKSFILDFFLRYLNAPRSSQISGEWLGRDDEPLQGFHWRGGGERDTTGIHLWPEPIITTMGEYGDKVAVLLMDTQGTFDSETTIRENSTIFALSTLMSSVQIYNLSGNIKEDDLQHLQLFTEYGKLVCQDESRAFQTLLMLVRDWEHYDHEHGYRGGRELLNTRLQLKQNQKKELMEVRQHIRSCFDKIECFLMPHPGKLVAKKAFTGFLRDIDEDFRLQLKEFVPSIFDPKNLTPKSIKGEPITTQDLLEYFRKYVDIFNGDDIPEAVTIFKATAEACMSAAVRGARSLYEARVGLRLRDELSVPAPLLVSWHHAAERDALAYFDRKKKLGSQQDIDYHLKELKKELEARWTLYMWKNDAKLRNTTALAKKTYEDTVGGVCEEQTRLCLHPQDLEQLHEEALNTALALFDSARNVPEGEEDEDRTALVESLEQTKCHFCAMNEQNNRSAVVSGRDVYSTRMKLVLHTAGVGTNLLLDHHQAALDEAREYFNKQRNRPTEQKHDLYMDQLLEEIDNNFKEFENMNTNSNLSAMQVAEFKYNNLITSAWGPQTCCFHPRALEKLHKSCMDETIREFFAHRTKCADDEYTGKLTQVLERRYAELKKTNEYNNEQAVELAFGVYTRKMDKHTQSSLGTILVVPFFTKLLVSVPRNHEKGTELALEEFDRRRLGDYYDNDKYLDKLKRRIEMAYSKYSDIKQAVWREFGASNEEEED